MSDRPLLAFCQVPKTAGVSLTRALRETFGLRHADVEPRAGQGLANVYAARDHVWTKRLHPGLRSVAGHRVSPAVSLGADDVIWCTVLRDPVERAMSHFRFRQRHHGYSGELQQWIADDAITDIHCRHIAGVADAAAAIEILSQENCEWDLVEHVDRLLGRLAVRVDEPRLARTLGRHNAAPEPADIGRADRDALASINEQDQLLLDWAQMMSERRADQPEAVSTTPPTVSSRHDQLNTIAARGWRNAVYRPALAVDRRLHRNTPTASGDQHAHR